MTTSTIKNLFLTGLLALGVFMALPSASQAVTDEEIASIGMAADSAETHRDEVVSPPSLPGILGRLALSLGFVFALMGGVLWVARRYFPKSIKHAGRGASIDILASRPLGQRRQLLLVRARGKTVLLGVTPQAIQCLTEIDEEALAWEDAAAGAGLSEDMNAAKPAGVETTGASGMGEL